MTPLFESIRVSISLLSCESAVYHTTEERRQKREFTHTKGFIATPSLLDTAVAQLFQIDHTVVSKMKIRLPSALMKETGGDGTEILSPSDDASCASENSSGSRGFFSRARSRSRSRSRSVSRLRQRKENIQNENNSTKTTNTNVSSTLKKQSPTKNIMKRFQRPFVSSEKPNKNVQSYELNSENEKENANPSSSSSSHESSAPNKDVQPPIDSSIVSIAEMAVALNFPSNCIRPVPIKREEINDSLSQTNARDDSTREKTKEGRSTENVDGSNGGIQEESLTTNGGETNMQEFSSDETKDDREYDPTNSPYAIRPSNSLLPPLDDDAGDDDVDGGRGRPKMLFPESHIEEREKNSPAMGSPNNSKGQEAMSPKPFVPPPSSNNPCVSSPLSDGSFHLSAGDNSSSSCDSSASAKQSSLVFENDDESNDRNYKSGKSTFRPPREVVTITSTPLVANDSTIRWRRKSGTDSNRNKHLSTSKSAGEGRSKRKNGRRSKPSLRDDDANKIATELAAKLVMDLEALREENEKQVTKNRRLEAKLQIIKAQQDEHMIHRGRLIKACLYTAPVFILCGGLDAFVATILLVWVLIEVENYLDGTEGQDNEDDDGADIDSEDDDGSESDIDMDIDMDIEIESFGDEGSIAL